MDWCLTYVCILVVLITGGYDGGGLNTAELFLPSNGTSCTLPSLPQTRDQHTVDNHILCGGYGEGPFALESCLQWSPDTGTWEELLTMNVSRAYHVSWTPASGIGTYLMSGRTTTLITPEGGEVTGFQLEYNTRWVLNKCSRVIFKSLTVFIAGTPVLSLTWTQWSSRVVMTPRPLCPGTMSGDG